MGSTGAHIVDGARHGPHACGVPPRELTVYLVGPGLCSDNIDGHAVALGHPAKVAILARPHKGSEIFIVHIEPIVLGKHPRGRLGDQALGIDEHSIHVEENCSNFVRGGALGCIVFNRCHTLTSLHDIVVVLVLDIFLARGAEDLDYDGVFEHIHLVQYIHGDAPAVAWLHVTDIARDVHPNSPGDEISRLFIRMFVLGQLRFFVEPDLDKERVGAIAQGFDVVSWHCLVKASIRMFPKHD